MHSFKMWQKILLFAVFLGLLTFSFLLLSVFRPTYIQYCLYLLYPFSWLKLSHVADNLHSPNIIFIVADDLGWNDVSWHNPSMITPNLDKLAHGGVILNQAYVQPICSPSRTAFMSGYFPIHVGLQHGVIWPLQPHGLPLNLTILPQEMKKLGYATHAIGKWHLGFCNWKYTPTDRGFDSFYGFFTGSEDYWTHDRTYEGCTGLDFRNNREPVPTQSGHYSTLTFAEQAVKIINEHDADKPLFLYLPFQAVHSPLEVPQKYADLYPNIKNKNRRNYCGMVSALDEAIGNITAALEKTGMMKKTLIAFTTDNGGQTNAGGNNYPLRGNKATLWEGGTRGAAFIHGKGLIYPKSIEDGIFHAVDWNPTLIAAAGGKPIASMDGLNQWPMLSEGKPSPRHEFVYNIDDLIGNAAIRVGDYKLLVGDPGEPSGWIPPPELDVDSYDGYKFRGNESVYLFNLKADPTEHYNLADVYPDLVATMKQRLIEYRKTMVPADNPPNDPHGDPAHFNNVWSPGWC